VTTEYRNLTEDDYEQAAKLEQRAFYNKVDPTYAERMKDIFRPEWTVGAFVDGRLVADTRTIPHVRWMHGGQTAFGGIGPVTCEAAFRRQGHVARLLTLALEQMRERGQWLAGLHTPHDGLYQRFGWERAEHKKRYKFKPQNFRLRSRGPRGRTAPLTPDDWQRMNAVYEAAYRPLNGAFERSELWWRESIMNTWDAGGRVPTDAVLWIDEQGRDRGYVVYLDRALASLDGGWTPHQIWIRDFCALDGDAYRALWEHMLTHDLADSITVEMHPDDRFRDLAENPFDVTVTVDEGAMYRIVDIERAIGERPYVGHRPASVTIAIEDRTLDWNTGAWRIEGGEAGMRAEKTDADPDFEMSINMLAPLFSGYTTPRVLANNGFIRVHREESLADLTELFTVADSPYCPDFY